MGLRSQDLHSPYIRELKTAESGRYGETVELRQEGARKSEDCLVKPKTSIELCITVRHRIKHAEMVSNFDANLNNIVSSSVVV